MGLILKLKAVSLNVMKLPTPVVNSVQRQS